MWGLFRIVWSVRMGVCAMCNVHVLNKIRDTRCIQQRWHNYFQAWPFSHKTCSPNSLLRYSLGEGMPVEKQIFHTQIWDNVHMFHIRIGKCLLSSTSATHIHSSRKGIYRIMWRCKYAMAFSSGEAIISHAARSDWGLPGKNAMQAPPVCLTTNRSKLLRNYMHKFHFGKCVFTPVHWHRHEGNQVSAKTSYLYPFSEWPTWNRYRSGQRVRVPFPTPTFSTHAHASILWLCIGCINIWWNYRSNIHIC